MILKVLHMLPAETAHNVTVMALKHGIYMRSRYRDADILRTSLWGLQFDNPLGLAAGFDKNAECYDAMLRLGMGFVEVGSITPQPQYGNPKPRLFRLPEDGAIINRFGFNNRGMACAYKNLRHRNRARGIVGVNLGKNKTTACVYTDFVLGCETLAPLADYLVVNVSSPNTPGLRALQAEDELRTILSAVQTTRNQVCTAALPPLLVKIAPDLADADIQVVCTVVQELGIEGIIVSNTTLQRPDHLHHQDILQQAGGLSGTPLFQLSTEKLKTVYRYTEGTIPLIGVGGVGSGRDAYTKIRAGASLVQLYSALVYAGSTLISQIKADLATHLQQDGFSHIHQAIGVDAQ